ncbi:MAG: SMP-30/gluconolactonase/LRE family protein [Armatimonadetes bacterium]|nr:SMP-30/gluconolactonase/LRE family protein [Armatimonadota bacterium]
MCRTVRALVVLIGGIAVTTMTSAQDLQGKVEGFADLFEPGAKVEKVATGFRFTEGPVWNKTGKFLLFSDIPANQIRKWESGDTTTVFREPSGNSNGLTYDKQGRLIACEHGNRRVSRTEPDGRITILADRYEGKRLNSPNDVVVKSEGSVYFTDPPYGVGPENRELDFQGVYRIRPEGGLALLVKDFVMPNGLAFSPDEKRLYIGDSSQRRHIRVFDVKPDGTLENGRVFADLSDPKPGAPDGMKVDTEGRLFSTGPGGVWVFAPDGTHLGTIETHEGPANCAWGETDWRTLFITAGTSVYRIRLKGAGVKVP